MSTKDDIISFMDANLKKIVDIRVKTVIRALEGNNITARYVETKEDALKLIKEIIPTGSLTATGGSATLNECGIIDYLKQNTNYADRYAAKTPEEKREAEINAYRANFYLASANAVTEHGEIYQVDGNSNRISALAYGPEKVILVVGINKIVKDLRSAVDRVKRSAAPANATRFAKGCFCEKAGHCIQNGFDENHLMCAAHCGDDTICRNTLIMSKQLNKQRVSVILVGEPLGY